MKEMKKCLVALSLAAFVVFGVVVSAGNTVLAEEPCNAACVEGEAVPTPMSSTLPGKPRVQ